jgi:hypothetical protein
VNKNNKKIKPHEERERLRQKELKNNPTGNLADGFNKANVGNLADLTGGLNWKSSLIIVLILAAILIGLYFFG